jgi:hypothetical protein
MILVLSILFALAYVFILRAPPTVPTPQLRAAQGTYAWRTAGSGSGTGDFSALAGGEASGSFSAEPGAGAQGKVESTYAAANRRETTLRQTAGGTATFATRTDAWPPAWLIATRSPLDYQGLSADVRAAVEDGDTSVGVKPFEQDGRKVWRAALTIDNVTRELVLDEISGLVTWCTDGSSTFSASVDWTATPQPAPALTPPAGAQTVAAVDRAYTYEASLAEAGHAAGFVPLVSGLAPDGYRQAAVATAATSGAAASWLETTSAAAASSGGRAAGSGASRQIVQLYVNGLSWFEVRQLEDPAIAAQLDRAYQAIGATALSFQRTSLGYGAFAGRAAATWYAESGPTLLVGDGRRVVYVTGALTRQQLVSLAEGLNPLGAAGASPAGDAASPGASAPTPTASAPASTAP